MYMHTKLKHGTTGLYNSEEHLWWGDRDFVPPYKEPNGANCYWSRGNGMVAAALVRTLQFLPEKIKGSRFYDPQNNQRENELRARLKSLWGNKYKY
jgi:rhamnogalacturonyl hydrolase YesR